jgi:Cdc6-like AAA superfamily ATPase
MLNLEKGSNPFNLDRPASKEGFVGRKYEINRILQLAHQVYLGKNEHIFLTGEYGIGKSSLASSIKYVAYDKFKLIGFHIFLGGVSTLEDMVKRIIENILDETYKVKAFDKVKEFVGKYIKEFHILGFTVDFKALLDDVPGITTRFVPFLRQVYGSLSDEYRGLILILDDINGMTRNPDFSFFIKSLVDGIATSSQPLPLLLILCGTESRRQEFSAHHQSVARIFSVFQVNPLESEEVKEFYRNWGQN